MKIGFDNDKYLKLQSEQIKKRISTFNNKLYLEFGGKLFDDYHASRVLPGFKPDSKLSMLLELKEQSEIVIVINADDTTGNKVRSDLGITYEMDVLRLVDSFRNIGLLVESIVITKFSAQPGAIRFRERLEKMGLKVYYHYEIENYPNDVDLIVSKDGFGKNEYVKTTKPLVVVTSPGPGSGKVATCMSQLYHESLKGIKAGYAKFETFPIWNLALKHPLNIAYEAATADLNDVNMIDPFHMEAYNEATVNYNRDIEIFPVLSTIFEELLGESPYKSPTDMGVNMVGECIKDEDICIEASKQEIIRRYYDCKENIKRGLENKDTLYKLELLMKQLHLTKDDRPVVIPAIKREIETSAPACAISLPDGTIITGKTSDLLGSASAVLLNALKALAGIDDNIHLVAPSAIEPIQTLKIEYLGSKNPRLHTDEILTALSISAGNDKLASLALKQLPKLKNCDAHSSVLLSYIDEQIFKKLGLYLTSEPKYEVEDLLYHKR